LNGFQKLLEKTGYGSSFREEILNYPEDMATISPTQQGSHSIASNRSQIDLKVAGFLIVLLFTFVSKDFSWLLFFMGMVLLVFVS
jgi:hypothetical protein